MNTAQPPLAPVCGTSPAHESAIAQVADSVMQARHAARQVKLDIEALPAVLTIQDALAVQSYVLPPVFVKRGDAALALSRAAHTLRGTLEVGGQEHFYLEGQVAYVLPQEQNQ